MTKTKISETTKRSQLQGRLFLVLIKSETKMEGSSKTNNQRLTRGRSIRREPETTDFDVSLRDCIYLVPNVFCDNIRHEVPQVMKLSEKPDVIKGPSFGDVMSTVSETRIIYQDTKSSWSFL